MKNKVIILFILIFTFIFFISCGEEEISLKEITCDYSETKVSYYLNEDIELDKLKVKAKFSDETIKDITDYTIDKSKYDKTKVGKYQIIISYKYGEISKEVSFEVEVIEEIEEVVLSSLQCNYENVKVDYIVGEKLDLTGLVVEALYSDNSKKVITNYEVDASGFISLKEGTYRIIINYTEEDITETAIYSVTVKSVLSTTNYLIGINVMPRNDYFVIGSEFNSDSLVVLAVYKDGSKTDVTDKVTIDSTKYNKDVLGVYEIIISYEESYGADEALVTISWDSFYFARVVESIEE